MVRSKKQTEWETVDHWHAQDGGLWSNDWLKKNKTRLQTGRVWRPGSVTPLEMFVCNNILLKSSLDYKQNDLGSIDILMKKYRSVSFEEPLTYWWKKKKKSTLEFEQIE